MDPVPAARAPGWEAVLFERMLRDEAADLDEPHVVVCRHAPSGTTSYLGPFPDGLSAAGAAQLHLDAVRGTDEEGQLRCTVAPLRPAGPR
jgi:hypothetical protein